MHLLHLILTFIFNLWNCIVVSFQILSVLIPSTYFTLTFKLYSIINMRFAGNTMLVVYTLLMTGGDVLFYIQCVVTWSPANIYTLFHFNIGHLIMFICLHNSLHVYMFAKFELYRNIVTKYVGYNVLKLWGLTGIFGSVIKSNHPKSNIISYIILLVFATLIRFFMVVFVYKDFAFDLNSVNTTSSIWSNFDWNNLYCIFSYSYLTKSPILFVPGMGYVGQADLVVIQNKQLGMFKAASPYEAHSFKVASPYENRFSSILHSLLPALKSFSDALPSNYEAGKSPATQVSDSLVNDQSQNNMPVIPVQVSDGPSKPVPNVNDNKPKKMDNSASNLTKTPTLYKPKNAYVGWAVSSIIDKVGVYQRSLSFLDGYYVNSKTTIHTIKGVMNTLDAKSLYHVGQIAYKTAILKQELSFGAHILVDMKTKQIIDTRLVSTPDLSLIKKPLDSEVYSGCAVITIVGSIGLKLGDIKNSTINSTSAITTNDVTFGEFGNFVGGFIAKKPSGLGLNTAVGLQSPSVDSSFLETVSPLIKNKQFYSLDDEDVNILIDGLVEQRGAWHMMGRCASSGLNQTGTKIGQSSKQAVVGALQSLQHEYKVGSYARYKEAKAEFMITREERWRTAGFGNLNNH
jgi:hypothetical protein